MQVRSLEREVRAWDTMYCILREIIQSFVYSGILYLATLWPCQSIQGSAASVHTQGLSAWTSADFPSLPTLFMSHYPKGNIWEAAKLEGYIIAWPLQLSSNFGPIT